MQFFLKIFYNKIMKYLIFILLNLSIFANTTLIHFLEIGKTGDYIVIKHGKIYSLLHIKKKEFTATLTKISISQDKISKNFSWKKWIKEGAYDNILYNGLKINLKNSEILKNYLIKDGKKIILQKDKNFFTKILNQPLKYLSDEKRRKIGPPPLNDQIDSRSIWTPPCFFEGKKEKNLNVYRTRWPKDSSNLSKKKIDLYFLKDKNFSFPMWIQVNTNHLRILLKTVDAGRDLIL